MSEVEVANEVGVANDGTFAGSDGGGGDDYNVSGGGGGGGESGSLLLSKEYVTELFDSYSFHFDHSLQALEYTSHLLVAEAVGEYLHVRAHNPSQIAHTPSQNSGGTSQNVSTSSQNVPPPSQPSQIESIAPVKYLGLDLGAGTGLACEPVKTAVVQAHSVNVKAQGLGLGPGQGLAQVAGQAQGLGQGQKLNPGEGDNDWGELVGMLGVDLSPKMLQKARKQG